MDSSDTSLRYVTLGERFLGPIFPDRGNPPPHQRCPEFTETTYFISEFDGADPKEWVYRGTIQYGLCTSYFATWFVAFLVSLVSLLHTPEYINMGNTRPVARA